MENVWPTINRCGWCVEIDAFVGMATAIHWRAVYPDALRNGLEALASMDVDISVFTAGSRHFVSRATDAEWAALHRLSRYQRDALLPWDEEDWSRIVRPGQED